MDINMNPIFIPPVVELKIGVSFRLRVLHVQNQWALQIDARGQDYEVRWAPGIPYEEGWSRHYLRLREGGMGWITWNLPFFVRHQAKHHAP
jgi:hypothetical protein